MLTSHGSERIPHFSFLCFPSLWSQREASCKQICPWSTACIDRVNENAFTGDLQWILPLQCCFLKKIKGLRPCASAFCETRSLGLLPGHPFLWGEQGLSQRGSPVAAGLTCWGFFATSSCLSFARFALLSHSLTRLDFQRLCSLIMNTYVYMNVYVLCLCIYTHITEINASGQKDVTGWGPDFLFWFIFVDQYIGGWMWGGPH